MGGSKLRIKRTPKGKPYAAIRWTINADREFMATVLALSNQRATTFIDYGKMRTRDVIKQTLKTEGMRGVILAINGRRPVNPDALKAAYMQIDRLWPELGDVQPVGVSHDRPACTCGTHTPHPFHHAPDCPVRLAGGE